MKKTVILILTMAMVIGLAACGSDGTDKMRTLVQGNIDAIYKGKASQEYLNIIGSTPEQEKDAYLSGLETEAEFFCYYFGIVDTSLGESYEDLREETRKKIVDMYKQIYAQSKYETKESVKQSDGSYTVQLTLEPIDIMEQVYYDLVGGTYAPYEEFNEKHADTNIDAMSDEEFEKFLEEYTDEYANVIIDCVLSHMPNLGYRDAKTMSIQIQENSDGFFSINDDDWTKIDDYMIYYP